MYKFKRILSVIIVLSLITAITAFVGCSISKGNRNSLVGKWYNTDGKCLDIRSDGTYKLEDDYGTGTWKFIEDNVTVEFADFYGDVLDTEIGEDANGQYIYLKNYGGYYYKDSLNGVYNYNDESLSLQNDGNMIVTQAYDFYDGFAWTVYTKDGKEYCGLVDTTGKIIYSEIYSEQKFHRMSGSLTYLESDDAYTLINSNGDVVMSSSNGYFDEVLAVGDSLALVYKYNGGVTTSEYLYGVVDSDGNWVQPLTDWGKEFYAINSYFSYIGDGMFAATKEAFPGSNVTIYNSTLNTFIYLEGINNEYNRKLVILDQYNDNHCQFYFYNNIAFFKVVSSGGTLSINNADLFSISKNFALNADGTYVELSEFICDSEGKLLRETDGHMEIFDYINNTTVILSDSNYSTSRYPSIYYAGRKGLLILDGADGNRYFTLIDDNAKELFNPIIYCGSFSSLDINYSYGKIVACTEKGIYNTYDENGTVLAEGLAYKRINAFYDDIAVAVDEDDNFCYINSRGEKVLTSLYE